MWHRTRSLPQYDCGTNNGINTMPMREGGAIREPLGQKLLGRTLCVDVKDPQTGEVIIAAGEMASEVDVGRVDACQVEVATIRSVLTCELHRGACTKCYGRDLGSGRLINVGEAIGVIAAQSIGEPGTQLTMRTFHFGGTATHKVETNTLESRFSGKASFHNLTTVKNRGGDFDCHQS